MAPHAMRIDIAKRLARRVEEFQAESCAELHTATALLARAQDGTVKRPRDANADAIQLDYDIGQCLQRNGWCWDAIRRKWRAPSALGEGAKIARGSMTSAVMQGRVESFLGWTETRGRLP